MSGEPGVLMNRFTDGLLHRMMRIDIHFVATGIARNARTLVTHPTRLFDIESCYPMEGALALGEPLIVQGILGVPFWLATGDPLSVFDGVLLTTMLVSALGMYLLLLHLTGSHTAGLIAGLAYGFHPIKTHDVAHYFVWDGVWTVLAVLFALRLFQERRARWGFALAAATAMQVLGSPYPLLAAALVSLPVATWLVLRYGVSGKVVLALTPTLLVAAGIALVLLAPYLDLRGEGVVFEHGRFHMAYAWLLPGERFFPGWAVPPLALAGVVWAGRRACSPAPGDARWAFLACALLCSSVSTTGFLAALGIESELPDPWSLLASIVPGTEIIRSPGAIFSGVHLALAVLAGLGAAALLRMVPGRSVPAVAAALLLVVGVDTLRPRFAHIGPSVSYTRLDITPDAKALAFFAELEEKGAEGPYFERWHPNRSELQWFSILDRNAEAVLLTLYHGRRTSACLGSFESTYQAELDELRAKLPGAAPLERLRALGFSTFVLHHAPGFGARAARRAYARFERPGPRHRLERLHEDATRTAYRLVPSSASSLP